MDLLGNLYYEGFEEVILQERHFAIEFFDLKTQLAGEVLQKFVNYRMRLTIVGNFEKYQSKPLDDFIRESNAGKHVNFRATVAESLHTLTDPT